MMQERDSSPVIREIQQRQEAIAISNPEVELASSSIVKIVSYAGSTTLGQGSGVLVEGGKIFTAYHVVEKADSLVLYTHANGHRLAISFAGDIMIDEEMDIAMFTLPEIFDDIVTPADIGSSSVEDSQLFLLGFPALQEQFHPSLYGQEPIILPTTLIIKDDHELFTLYEDQVQMIMFGSSGGALVNSEGRVVGINHSGYSFTNAKGTISHMGYATDLESALEALTH